jgi:hypothetical protein
MLILNVIPAMRRATSSEILRIFLLIQIEKEEESSKTYKQ